jgi:methylmalonyl-CoA/ethylmalonyl-CoA epimerase
MKIHHYGIVTRNLEEEVKNFLVNIPTATVSETIVDPLQKCKIIFLTFEGGMLEFITPNALDSPVSNILLRGQAFHHHICIETNNFEDTIDDWQTGDERWLMVSSPKPAVAFNGRKVAFFVNATGLLVELLEGKH